MKIGVLGSGEVGTALSNGFLKYGYTVMRGSRHPEKLADWKTKSGDGALIGTFEEAAKFGETIVLAVKGTAAEELVQQQASSFKNKIIFDTTNPIADAPPKDGVLKFFTNLDESLLERLQKAAPEAHFVKVFNSVGNSLMVNPQFGGIKPTMFICGNNNPAKARAQEILSQFGWESEDMGIAAAARAIEPLCMLWCIPGFLKNDWNHAFKLLRS
ncbi:DNA-binding protein [Bdellovibrio sp. qaytius]|nr:DNA-binding protein [Bdellovibrio sp. qaytius]